MSAKKALSAGDLRPTPVTGHSPAMEDLFRAVQSACSRSTWSRGVELARTEAVVGERQDEEECLLRVTVPGDLMARVVTLYPQDLDWECSCNDQDQACEHVAAASIA
ncbi:MAG: hypothetical protein VCC04_04605, partial [Myxococcota bacterium]